MIMQVNIKSIFIISAPQLNLNFKCANKKVNVASNGKRAGYNLMLSAKLPFSNSITALWKPHPRHSKPKFFL